MHCYDVNQMLENHMVGWQMGGGEFESNKKILSLESDRNDSVCSLFSTSRMCRGCGCVCVCVKESGRENSSTYDSFVKRNRPNVIRLLPEPQNSCIFYSSSENIPVLLIIIFFFFYSFVPISLLSSFYCYFMFLYDF